jgi:tetratricopeptide (TPR) repeat protein
MKSIRNLCLLALLVSLLTPAEAAEEKRSFFRLGKKKEDPAAAAAAAGPDFRFPKSLEGIDFSIQAAGQIPNDPWRHLWSSSEFQRRFTGRYGFLANVEPELTETNEIAFMRELAPLLQADPKLAAYVLKTNLTANKNAQLDFTLGSLYFQMLDYPSAVNAYQTAVDKYPDFRRAHKNLGFSYLKMGKYAEAAAPLSAAIELGDRDSTTFGLLGFCYLNQERFIPAEAAYKQAILFQPDNADWRLGLVKALVAQEKLQEANRMVEEVLQRDPSDVDMWELQAGIYAQMEQPKLAAVNYEIIRKLGKSTPPMLYSLGDLYMADEATDLALPVYLAAIRQNGTDDIPRALRTAKILVSRGELAEAKQILASIRQAAGNELANENELELLKSESKVANAEGDSAQAVKILESVVERDPLDGEALLLIGDHYLRSDQIEKAEFRYELASKIEGFEADALVKLAQVRVKQSKYDDAIAVLNKAQKINPRDTVQNYLEAIERIRRTSA